MTRPPSLAPILIALAFAPAAARAQSTPPPPKPEPPPVDYAALRKALAAPLTGAASDALAEKLRLWFGADALERGTAVRTEGLEAAFALAAPGAQKVQVASVDGGFHRVPLQPVGATGLWAAVETFSDGTAFRFWFEVDGRRLGSGQVEAFTIHPDSLARPGVPRGKVMQQPRWKSRIYADTERDWWIYVPAQYRPSKPAAVMVFQDGGVHFLKQIPTVFDNLIHRGDMPVTAAVFLNPGVFPDGRRNRGVEYDTLSDEYARFLIEEILPAVEKTVRLRKDPESRAIGGMSSGGMCAFKVAWERPDQFRKVLSWVGSFTNNAPGATQREGGHNYAALVRRVPRKPIRIFLQDGDQDLDHEAGSWSLANRTMERSLERARYDFRMVWGHGFHSTKHGYSILPESLRWLWRDHRTSP